MEQIAILPPIPTATMQGAGDLASGFVSMAAERPSGGGYAVGAFGSLFADEPSSGRFIADEIVLKSVDVELDVDKSLNRTVARVKDRETGEVLSQFPAEAVLNNARAIRDLLAKQLDIEV